MPKVKVVKLIEDVNLPSYQTKGSAAMDVEAAESKVIAPGSVEVVSTGLKFELPEGYELQIRPRSGIAFKHGVSVLNSPGTLDEDYRGELKIILINHGTKDFVINKGDRIAQILLKKYEKIEWEHVTSLNDSERGSGGFGSTGK
ncbi:dUTP diphosphatase [Candidatus Woesearchaeota archaeon]|nr:MAG: dUTP diphosphatase [Candidatus Woesearchaeota archaeon]